MDGDGIVSIEAMVQPMHGEMRCRFRDIMRCSPWNGSFLFEFKIQVVRKSVEMSICCRMCRLLDSWNGRVCLLPGLLIS